MLILFDIDGTLLRTAGAGAKAMVDAGRELFGEHFTLDGIAISGRLDPLIWNDAAQLASIADAHLHHDRFRRTYGRKLRERLDRDPTAELYPGVRELINELRRDRNIALGVLTGNYPETGRLKIERAGLDPDIFTIDAWGCDGALRRDLPAVALGKCQGRLGRIIASHDTVVIGDTPHDIDCARHHGCRSIGVATGEFNITALEACGADLAVENLTDVVLLMDWLHRRKSSQTVSK